MDTTVLQNWPRNIITDCKVDDVSQLPQVQDLWSNDIVDNPKKDEHFLSNELSQYEIFGTMKHELNRLNSFKNKWPLDSIKPEDLAEAGFFYLQTEDRVQCAFCYVIIYSWNRDDRPLREHMKKSPRCPFLMSSNVGNVPLYRETPCFPSSINHHKEHNRTSKSVSLSYKPKHPRMADIRRRLMTYEAWPLKILNVQQLAKCGLYYTGVSDVVTCFFCGGSLGNWEVDDDPWIEHTKFFPNCAYLSLAKHQIEKSETKFASASNNTQTIAAEREASYNKPLGSCIESEIVEEAFEIFPKPLVLAVLSQYKKKTGGTFSSLHQLCEEVLEYKESQKKLELKLKESENSVNSGKDFFEIGESILPETSAASIKRDTLLCKICMDQEMGVVFQPCGHLVSCVKCSREISNCPLCRRPITNIVRTYLS